MVLGVPGARDLGVRGTEWTDEDEAKLVRALEKGKPGSSPSCHDGSEVTAGLLQRGGAWGQGVAGVPRVAVEQQEVACGPPRRRRRCSAPTEEDCWTFLQFLKNLGILL